MAAVKRGLLIDDLREISQAINIATSRYAGAAEALSQVTTWDVARSLEDAKAAMRTWKYWVLLVDHDLGDAVTDGSHALMWLAEHWLDRGCNAAHGLEPYLSWLPEHVFAVSSNPVGIKKIDECGKDLRQLAASS